MLSATTTFNFNLSTLNFFPSCSYMLKSFKLISSPRFPFSKYVSNKAFLQTKNLMGSQNMVELVRASAFRNTRDDEGVSVLEEEEELIDGLSQFPSGLISINIQSTINRMSKWLVSVLFAALILWRHDAEAMWVAMGSIVNSVLSVVLKKIINQERPVSGLKSDPGMPSSHAQSIFFTVTFAILSIIEWLGINGIMFTASGFFLAFGSYLSWLRVAQQLHTTSQVIVGAVLGSFFSIFWYWLWNAFVAEAFVSSLWVKIIVLMLFAAFCIGLLVYVIRYWLRDEQ